MARNHPNRSNNVTTKPADPSNEPPVENEEDGAGEEGDDEEPELPIVDGVGAGTIDPNLAPALMPGGAPGFISDAETAVGGAKPIGAWKASEPVAGPKSFMVVNGGRVLIDGGLTMIRAGKVVSELTHDLEHLRAQGIILEPFEPKS